MLDTGGERMLARLDIDLVQCLDVFGDKRNRDDQQMLLPFPRQTFQRVPQRRLEPFLPADAALKAQRMRVGPGSVGHHSGDGFLHMPLVRVAAGDEA